MKSFWKPILIILWKDLLIEFRTKDISTSVLVFSLLVVVLFNFAITPTPQILATVIPGMLWIAITFGGVLGLSRSVSAEMAHDNIHGLMLVPVDRDIIFFGKMLSTFIFMLIVELIIFPVNSILFNLPIVTIELIPVAILTTLGIATVGTLMSSMAAHTRSREMMLPLLFLPVIAPLLIGAVEASSLAMSIGSGHVSSPWIPFLGIFDAIFLVICPIAFNIIIQE